MRKVMVRMEEGREERKEGRKEVGYGKKEGRKIWKERKERQLY